MEVGFGYGILSGKLEEQANKQGFTLGEHAEMLDDVKDAINVCRMTVATDSQVKAMTSKLHKDVMKKLKRLESPLPTSE